MHRGAKVETSDNIPSRTRSFSSAKFSKISAVLALQRPDGHIQLEFPAEDAIDLQTPRVDATGNTNQSSDPPTHGQDNDSKKQPTTRLDTDLVSVPPLMSICILIVGTRGDVQPFLAIAQRLQRDGHRVRLATHAVYRDFVMSHGVEFYPLGGDPKELAAYMVKTGGHLIPTKIETLTKDVPRNRTMINEIVLSTWPAVSEADPDGGGPGVPGPPFRAQAIIANPVSYGHIHVAERLGVPLHIMFPQPWVPTMAFPHPLSNLAYTGKLQKRNYISYKLVDLIMWYGAKGIVNRFRTEVLKLRPIRNGDLGSELLLDLEIPHAFMWSPRLVPKPADWGDLYDVIGTVSLKEAASVYSPSPELEAFLGDDGGPIFVGFGSMVLADPLATTKMIVEAATQAKVRVLIQSSWSDMAGDLEIPSNVFFIGNCPHDWLMPRVSAVVHHGADVLTQFRAFIGLQKRCDQPDPLVRCEVPHIYLWNPALLSKPLDWGAELSVVGHVMLGSSAGLSRRKRKKREKESKRFKWPSALTEFAFQMPTPPVIYFGVSTRTMSPGMLDELLRKVDSAAATPAQQVRIVFQTREVGDKQRTLFKSANVLEIASDLPYARLFQEQAVVGAIHWGEPDIIAESLSAGKPTGVCGTHSCQQFMASVCGRSQASLSLIDWRTCTAESLASSFRGLLKPDIREKAQSLATTFNPKQALNAAVTAFYANLPIEAMRCDVDPGKLARVFDSRHDLKLSLEAYVSIQPRYDESKGFVPYTPLRFGGCRTPTFFIRGNPGETTRNVKPIPQHDGVQLALESLEHGRGRSSSSSSSSSLDVSPAKIALFWSSAEEEAAVRKATNVAYARLVKKSQRKSKREALMRFFGVGNEARRREEELRYISVE
ncbi:Sterol 3-beta-glucosyltransferase [Phytophthora cinnamomi]|uniref:Sterol 3-beta-glucosyltransferase n=1 Tax=Phytophthora cinnamomi TaxID=4785 RepID=UPI003559A99E|nr:Sterol 3-beta-glucosyltransferase [Phytophthora cinnamomi]